jgi:2-polyprenyl-3-methyl-5-hydroxy-6-metoxy-1,4-benzoquinol methylase
MVSGVRLEYVTWCPFIGYLRVHRTAANENVRACPVISLEAGFRGRYFVGRVWHVRQLAEEYLAHARDGAFNAYYDRPAVLAVLGSVAGLAVLDLGCGPGLYAEELLARGAGRVAGVDASAAMVRLARERVRGPVVFHARTCKRRCRGPAKANSTWR